MGKGNVLQIFNDSQMFGGQMSGKLMAGDQMVGEHEKVDQHTEDPFPTILHINDSQSLLHRPQLVWVMGSSGQQNEIQNNILCFAERS
jgi:hypothetical protein